MTYLAEAPCLEFASPVGTFLVKPVASTIELYALCIESDELETRELGRYCGINDAVLAVSRQETGLDRWDHLSPRELPFRVHDIACWKLRENFGTKGELRGSIAQ